MVVVKRLTILVLFCVMIAVPANLAVGQIQGKTWTTDQFPEFIAALAEMNSTDQKQYLKEYLTEYYDQDCQEKKRRVKRDSIVRLWRYVLPGMPDRMKHKSTINISDGGKSLRLVSVVRNESRLHRILYFDWDESAKSWFVTGFKSEISEPGDCI